MPMGLYDIQPASNEAYDFIVSTVVLMFLQADRTFSYYPKNMQETVSGYNLSSVPWIQRIIAPHSLLRGVGGSTGEMVKYNENQDICTVVMNKRMHSTTLCDHVSQKVK